MTKEVFITSDHHFFHKNILKYQGATRPFDTVQEMGDSLIQRHNEVVSPNDEVYMLGDFGFASPKYLEPILEQMNGIKYFVFGNHDRSMRNKHIERHFQWMRDYAEIKVDDKNCILFHFPIHSWNKMHYGAYQFYGHTHGQIPHLYHGRSMDIGVDTNDCYPWNIRDIFKMYKKVEEEANEEDFHTDPRGRDEKR